MTERVNGDFHTVCDKHNRLLDSFSLTITQPIHVERLPHTRRCAEYWVGYDNTRDINPTVQDFKIWKGRKHSDTNDRMQQRSAEHFKNNNNRECWGRREGVTSAAQRLWGAFMQAWHQCMAWKDGEDLEMKGGH